MNSQLPRLVELQAIDRRIAENKDQQRHIPLQIQAADAPLQAATRALQALAARVEGLGKERRDRERDLESQEASIQKLRGRLTDLKTNKEYQAHLFEIEVANKRKGEIEEQVLLVMEGLDKAQEELRQLKTTVDQATKQFQQEKSKLEALAGTLEAELAELDQKHTEIAATVAKDLLDRYLRLKAGRKDLALAPVRNGICQGCRLQLPPQLVAEIKRSTELQVCSYCQRILYVELDPTAGGAPAVEPPEPANREQ